MWCFVHVLKLLPCLEAEVTSKTNAISVTVKYEMHDYTEKIADRAYTFQKVGSLNLWALFGGIV